MKRDFNNIILLLLTSCRIVRVTQSNEYTTTTIARSLDLLEWMHAYMEQNHVARLLSCGGVRVPLKTAQPTDNGMQ